MGTVLTLSLGALVAGPAVVAPAASAAPAAPTHALTPAEASAQARKAGKDVPIPGATTPTVTLTAKPDGSFAQKISVAPVRKLVNGAWTALDATLHATADGQIAPAVATNDLHLSGGGSAALATMTNRGKAMSLSLPMALPKPTLAGPTATYANVLPGVDLQVTADTQGGFREVFVVQNATAARNPLLASLTLGVKTTGLTMKADATGNLTAMDPSGQAVFGAPAPQSWDSSTTAPLAGGRSLGSASDPGRGLAQSSTVDGPGFRAHHAMMKVTVGAQSIGLATPASLLTGADTVFPLFLDPAFKPYTPGRGGYASMPENYPTSNYWYNTGDPSSDNLQVGDTGSWRSHTLLNFPIDNTLLAHADIGQVTLNMLNVYSYSCTTTDTDLYAPAVTLTQGNATWNSWFGSNPVQLGPVIDHPNFAHGYNSSCSPNKVGFDARNGVLSALSNGRPIQTFVLTGAANETSDPNSWKKFSLANATLEIDYNHKPDAPSELSTSPASACTGTPTTVGDGPVTLSARVTDPDNNGNLGVTYQVWKTSDQSHSILYSTSPDTFIAVPGTLATTVVPEATLKAAAGGAVTQFTWQVDARDDEPSTGGWSGCSFNFDPTRTGAPIINPVQPGSTTIGTPFSLTVNHPATGTLPTSYLYQLNGGVPGTVTADGSGNASITITPTRFTNTLSVTSRSAGGNIGDAASVVFNATPTATPAADADLTGDGPADLLTVGGTTSSLPSGLWLAAGQNNGQLNPTAGDLGANGNGVFGTNLPSDFDGAQVLSGHFTGTGLQDVLAYYPGGNDAGGGTILSGNGDGSTLQAQLSGNESTISSGTLADLNGLNPIQIANAGNSAGQNLAYPDLIAVGGNATVGYYLDYYPNMDFIGGYAVADQLSVNSPDGTLDWNQWTIATAQLPTSTAMFLWKKSTGALYVWTNLAHTPFGTDLNYTPHTLAASGWNTGATISLEAADINRDGSPDLWAVNGSTVTASLVTNLSSTPPTITAQPAQTLLASGHQWTLSDLPAGSASGSPVSLAHDTSPPGTTLRNLTGTSGAHWQTGDLFSPDVALDGTSGALSANGPAIVTNGDFTATVWVKPTALGGTVLSQDGTNTAGLRLWAEASDGSWRFAMSTSDVASPTWNTVSSAPSTVAFGVWTQLTITYAQSTGMMNLYVNGVNAGTAVHTTTWNATGAWQVGDYRSSTGAHGGFFAGQVANIQEWPWTLAQADPGWVHYSGLVCGDINGDGNQDILAVNDTNGNQYAWYGDGSGGFARRSVDVPGANNYRWFAMADFTGDGKPDLVAIRNSDDELVRWVGNGDGTFTFMGNVGGGWGPYRDLVAGDFNGDGKADIAAINTSDTLLYHWFGTGGGGFGAGVNNGPGWPAYTNLTVADVNSDGKADLAATRISDGGLARWTGDGSGNFGYIGDYGGGWNAYREVTACDYNNDGRKDLVAINPAGALVRWHADGMGWAFTG
jgi:hypothetical protein